MRKIVNLVFILLSVTVFAQKDSIRFKAVVKTYTDHLVIRWAPKFPRDYYLLTRTGIVVQKQVGASPYQTIKSMVPEKTENWAKDLDPGNRYAQLASGCFDNLNNLFTQPESNVYKAMENSKTADFLYANLLLSADLYPRLAELLALRFEDQAVENNESYNYKIFAASQGYYTDTIYIRVLFKNHVPEEPSPWLNVISKEKQAEFIWNANPKYSAYFIEKFDAKAKSFKPLNTHALLVPGGGQTTKTMRYSDSFSRNYKPVDYRIYGVDAFGDPSPYSNVVAAMGIDQTPPPMPGMMRLKRLNDTTVRISWNRINAENGERSLSLGLNHFTEGEFTSLTPDGLPLSDTVFIYKGNSQYSDLHFALYVYDSAGNSSYSKAYVQLPDKKAPSTPKGLKAQVNKQGVVTLNWEWNAENDFDGYLVYSAMDSTAEFSGLVNRPMMDTCFRDTLSLKMLNSKVYYRVVAVDKYFNKSKPTSIATILRPDTLRPVSPVFTSYLCTDTSIHLSWVPSSSVDVKLQYLLKTNIKTKKVQRIDLSKVDSMYTDRNVVPETYYRYTLIAEDENQNQSIPGNPLDLKAYKKLYKDPIKIIVAKYKPTEKTVELTWRYDQKNIKAYDIYRGTSMDRVSFYASTNHALLTFNDNGISPGKTYYYSVKARFTDGTLTILSQAVSVVVSE